MIALDTNILARFYVDDATDPESAKQRPIARRVLTESRQVFVPLTVVLELEWVLFYFHFDKTSIIHGQAVIDSITAGMLSIATSPIARSSSSASRLSKTLL